MCSERVWAHTRQLVHTLRIPSSAQLLERGFVVGTAREKVIRLLPPYIVPKQALKEFIAALSEVLTVIPSPSAELRAGSATKQSPPATGRLLRSLARYDCLVDLRLLLSLHSLAMTHHKEFAYTT